MSQETDKQIEVQFMGACNRCEAINFRSRTSVSQKEFESNKARFPNEYWSSSGEVVTHHQYEQSSRYNCKYSCN